MLSCRFVIIVNCVSWVVWDIRFSSAQAGKQHCFIYICRSYSLGCLGIDVVKSEHLLHLLMCNDRVVLHQQVFLLLKIVERATMRLCMTVLRAVNVTTFAFGLDESDFTIAVPTLGLVFLYFWLFFFHLFLGLFVFHLGITFYNWFRLKHWLQWLFDFFICWFYRLVGELRFIRESFCNFFHKFLDW